ncbi:MAG: septum formation initiator family protein [Gammaproteobacteria bacterium]|nr:septum formation initiator family protein [Gammaproteobacteria bacterium]MDO9317673.1 septum formation initiator family protein [Gammaproteobacteria bacterium]
MKVLLGALVVVLVMLQFNLWVGEGSFSQLRSLESQVEVQKQENVVLADRNQELENEVLDLKTGLDAVEERARSDFGMVKDGETLFLIVE